MKDLTLNRTEVEAFICSLRLAIVQLENDKQIDYELYMEIEQKIKELSRLLETVFCELTGTEKQFLFD